MRSRRGFTLIELAIVMAVVAILAGTAAAGFASARRNASTGAVAFDLALRLQGLKTRALQEQKDYVALLVNPTGDVSKGCTLITSSSCARLFILAAPPSSWSPNSFSPSSPSYVDDVVVVQGEVVVDTGGAGTASPAPFASITQLPASMVGSCGGLKCVAVRFTAGGDVKAVYTGAAPSPAPTGVAIGLTSDALRTELKTRRRAVLVTFPTGIVKTYTY